MNPIAENCKLSIVIPILNKRDNIEPLISSIDKAVPEKCCPYEIIFVDDGSNDGSRELLDEYIKQKPNVRKVFRTGYKDLNQSVLDGFSIAKGDVLMVMHSDQKHNPKYIPELYHACLESDGLSLASQYNLKSKTFEKNRIRRLEILFPKLLARFILNIKVSDPMTGFFAVSRSVFDKVAHRIDSVGYNALIAIIFNARGSGIKVKRIGEVSYVMPTHRHVELMTVIKTHYQFLCQILVLLLRFRSVELMSFCLVGTQGLAIHLVTLNIALWSGLNFHIANIIALIIAATHNYFLNLHLTFTDIREQPHTGFSTWSLYLLANGVSLIANTSVASAIHTAIDLVNVASICGIFVGIIWNFSIGRYLLKS